MVDTEAKIELLERETLEEGTKLAVRILVPCIRDHRSFFGHKIYNEPPWEWYAKPDEHGFPKFGFGQFWTGSRPLAHKLLEAAKKHAFEPIFHYGDPDRGRYG